MSELIALSGYRCEQLRVVKSGLDVPSYNPRQLEVLVVECLRFGGAEGERADDASLHAQRDRQHRDAPLRGPAQVRAPFEVVDVDRVPTDDGLPREAGVDRKGAMGGSGYKTPSLPVIQRMDGVVGSVLGHED